jgi:NADP-dependent 3-hydroxy acid dehydrogenase YdfG
LVESELTTLNKTQSPERKAMLEKMPILKSEDIADVLGYALPPPDHLQLNENLEKS